MDREGLILAALNHYWNDAQDQLMNGELLSNGDRRSLGNIEEEQLRERRSLCKQLMDEIEQDFEPLEGFKTYRHGQNPKEKELHDKFIEWYLTPGGGNVDLLVFQPLDMTQSRAIDTLSAREIRIMITMVQWMGTPLGQSLLRECGFELKEKS